MPSCPSTANASPTAATSPARSRRSHPDSKVDDHILRGQKEQTIAVKLGKFPTGKELAKVRAASPKEPQATEMDQLGLSGCAGQRRRQGRRGRHRCRRWRSDAAQKGIKSGDIILEVGGLTVKSPDDVANGVKEASKLGRKAVLDAHQVGRPDALCGRTTEEELTPSSAHAHPARRPVRSRTGRLIRYFQVDCVCTLSSASDMVNSSGTGPCVCS